MLLAKRGDRAADGPDGLSRHAQRTGQSRPAARCRLGRHAAARRLGFDDLCRPRSGQPAGLAGVGHGDGAADRRRRAVHRLSDQRDAGQQPWAHVNVLFSRNVGLSLVAILLYTADQPVQLVAGAEFPQRCCVDAAGTKSGVLLLTYGALAVFGAGAALDLPASAFRCALRRSSSAFRRSRPPTCGARN